MKAADFLRQAAEVIEQRGTLRDKPDGERSMERAVDAYITLNGPNMQGELDGWLFLCVLKLARATAGGKPHLDDYTDLAGYAALAAECVQREADTEYDDTITRVFGDGWTNTIYDWPKPGATPPASAAAGCDSLGRTDPKAPVDMDAFRVKSPIMDALYERAADPKVESEPDIAKNDGWIEHRLDATEMPVDPNTRVIIVCRDGWASDNYAEARLWKQEFLTTNETRVQKYKIKED